MNIPKKMQNILRLFSKLVINFLRILNLKKSFSNKLNFNIGLNSLIHNKKFYETAKNINEVELKINSQNGEDGIIDFLTYKLNISKTNFVEIGVGEYIEANTRFLYDRYHPRGLIIDCIKDLKNKVSSNVNLWKGELNIVEHSVNADNINQILKDNCNFEIDLFSLDIDSTDYWIIERLKSKVSKIFIAEYNSVFGDKYDVSVPNLEKFDRASYHHSGLCYGMSLRALVRLMKIKGFYFIGTNTLKNNAFFINEDYPFKDYFTNFNEIDYLDLETYTDSVFSESRDRSGKLNYLRGKSRLEEIKECEIIDFSDNNGTLKKIENITI